MSQEERRKRRVRKQKIKLAFVGFVFLYLLLRSIPSLGYKTKLPEKQTIYEKIESEAILIKDEKVYSAEGEGKLKIYTKEGQKVPVGQKIAEIYLLDDKSALMNRLEEVDRKIEVLSEVEGENLSSDRDLEKVENNLKDTIDEMQASIYNKEYDKAVLLKNELLTYYDKQKNISGDNTLVENSLDSLKQQREDIMKQINSNIIEYNSDRSGILSFKIDGYENKFTKSNRDAYGYKDFENLTEEYKAVSNNENVEVGQPIFKIINNFEWYMLIKIDNISNIESYEEGKSIVVSCKDIEGELKGRIIKIKKNGNKGTILCKFDRDFQYFYDKRIIDVDIILSKHESYKIPRKALTELNGAKGVYIKDVSGIVKFRPVKVLKEDDEYAYIRVGDKDGMLSLAKDGELIKTVTQFDEILINPSKVAEGMIIN